MAEAVHPDETNCQEIVKDIECAVCLQRCVHPAQLPCGHIFCFLCVKGFANQNKKCAMCRQDIPIDFLEHPHLVETPVLSEETEGFDGGYQWFYGGRNGWWQYDERTSKDLELAYKRNEKTCELLIAGFLYIIDLESMLQVRRNDPSRRRKIKRDFNSVPKKGIAGLSTTEQIGKRHENLDSHNHESTEEPSVNLTEIHSEDNLPNLEETLQILDMLSLNDGNQDSRS